MQRKAYEKCYTLQTYFTFLLTKLYESTGFFEKQTDDQLEILKRIQVLNHACMLGFEDCVRNAVNQFHSWRYASQPDLTNP